MNIDKSDLEKIYDALEDAMVFFERRDEMNSKVHLGVPRYSPITSKLQAETDRLRRIIED